MKTDSKADVYLNEESRSSTTMEAIDINTKRKLISKEEEEEKEDDGFSNHEDLFMIGNFSIQTPELNRHEL